MRGQSCAPMQDPCTATCFHWLPGQQDSACCPDVRVSLATSAVCRWIAVHAKHWATDRSNHLPTARACKVAGAQQLLQQFEVRHCGVALAPGPEIVAKAARSALAASLLQPQRSDAASVVWGLSTANLKRPSRVTVALVACYHGATSGSVAGGVARTGNRRCGGPARR